MGTIKTIERKGKRLLIRVITSLVKTQPLSKDEIFARPPERILVIRQHNQMGDMLLAVPALRAIKGTFPQAELDVLTARINRDVLLNNPSIARVFTYVSYNPVTLSSLIRRLRQRRYDVVIVLHTVSFSFTSALLGLLSGARFRVGSTSRPFGNRLGASFYHLELPLPDDNELQGMNEAEHNVYPLRAIGVDTSDLAPIVVPTAENVVQARKFVTENTTEDRVAIVVHPGAGKIGNIWPPENFAEVVNLLSRQHDIDVLVVEGPRDAPPVDVFRRRLKMGCTVLRGRAIGEVAAVLKLADLVLCNDTGVMHVSCAAGAPTLAVFGPTDPVRWAPRCSNLTVARAEDGDLTRLSANTVYKKASTLLDRALVDGAQRDI